ncbi:MAG: late competence development ComFB family protein [Oscillospiraceae bacterium]|nr:late competence development ComFB family protein [Oscillospiraceae bacterium]
MEFQLRNYTQEAVQLYLERWFKVSDCCHCDACRMDVTAIMLNNMKPRYVVTDKGALYAQLDEFDPQYRTDLMTLMSQATIVVKNSPRHK